MSEALLSQNTTPEQGTDIRKIADRLSMRSWGSQRVTHPLYLDIKKCLCVWITEYCVRMMAYCVRMTAYCVQMTSYYLQMTVVSPKSCIIQCILAENCAKIFDKWSNPEVLREVVRLLGGYCTFPQRGFEVYREDSNHLRGSLKFF